MLKDITIEDYRLEAENLSFSGRNTPVESNPIVVKETILAVVENQQKIVVQRRLAIAKAIALHGFTLKPI